MSAYIKISIVIVSLIALTLLAALNIYPAQATHVQPTTTTGNPTCTSLGYLYEYKIDPPIPGTYPVGNGTVTWSSPATGSVDWSSTIGIDAVIVKGGQQGANVYRYNPESFGDVGLSTPNNPNGLPADISHVSFCYDYEVVVSKTAITSFTRTLAWEIDKSVTPETWNLFRNDSGASKYTVAVDKIATDSDWAVSGVITIYNPDPINSAVIVSVTDVVSGGIGLSVNCGVPIPPAFSLGAGQTLTCTYSGGLPDGSSRTNTATVATDSLVFNDSGSAEVIFGDPTTIVGLSSINVDDDVQGPLGSFSDDGSVSYTQTFTCDGDEGAHQNTATIRETSQSAGAAVTVNCDELAVSKDVTTNSTRTWRWTIDKIGDQTDVTLLTGQQFPVNYTVRVSATSADSDWLVSGSILISNPALVEAKLASVSDVISGGIAASVDCPALIVPAGGVLTCDYTASAPDASNRLNTATATLQNYAYGPDGSSAPNGATDFTGSADVTFGDPTTLTDECVNVNDDKYGALGGACADESPKTFSYNLLGGPYATCGDYQYTNTATFTAADTGATGSDSWTVNVHIPCGNGCAYSLGYWKAHAGFGPQPDIVTPLLPQSLGAPGGPKSIQVMNAAQAVQLLSFRGSNNIYNASNGINKLYAWLLVAKLNIANGVSNAQAASLIAAADAFLANTNSTDWNGLTKAQQRQVLDWMSKLNNSNNGQSNPGHCSE